MDRERDMASMVGYWGHEQQFQSVAARAARRLALEVERLRADQAEAMEHLVDVVGQACFSQDGDLDSMATSAYAEAMLYLAKIGKIELDGEPVGRRVIGKWKEG